MLRSFYAGVSGLKNHQVRLDVLGNNISNVNTVGFKKGRVTFQELLSQTLKEANAISNASNPQQIGGGVSISNIDGIFIQGIPQTTDNPTDLMIQGDDFFVLTDGVNRYYTRAGSFGFDGEGNLIDNAAKGLKVVGDVDLKLPAGTQSFNITTAGDFYCDGTKVGTIQLTRFANPSGLKKIGENLYTATSNSGAANPGNPGVDGRGTLVPGALEMSNVDLTEEMTEMIITQRGFQANARIITTSDQMMDEIVNLKR